MNENYRNLIFLLFHQVALARKRRKTLRYELTPVYTTTVSLWSFSLNPHSTHFFTEWHAGKLGNTMSKLTNY